jgi:hypothetical protein
MAAYKKQRIWACHVLAMKSSFTTKLLEKARYARDSDGDN